jgi:orotidine-5'-phosphate decarboxylase
VAVARRPRARARESLARVPTPIVALDVPSSQGAVRLVEQLGDLCSFYKVGSELFTASGPAIVDYLRARGAEVFLDLKLHDIPNTVERAASAAAASGARLLTVHASGGSEMIRAAVDGAAAGTAPGRTRCGVLGVTVLTSLDGARLGVAWGRRIRSVKQEVLRLATLAADAGAEGIVCSGAELEAVRRAFGNSLQVLVPGVRPAAGARGDQVRVVTAAGAAQAGADYVVLGRAVTQAPDPAAALAALVQELGG